MVKVLTIILFAFSQFFYVFTELCVLKELVTIKKPICKQLKCNNTITFNKFSPRSFLKYPMVPIGSPSAAHFLSISDNDDDDINIIAFKRRMYLGVKKSKMNCSYYKYRTIDGSCNNLEHPEWGKSQTPFARMLFPRYSKYPVGFIPSAVSGHALPLPRVLSTTLFPDFDRPWQSFTLITMQWGQIVAHDATLSPSGAMNIDCCLIKDLQQCCPIQIPKNDKFYSKFGVTCTNMVRTKNVEQLSYNCEKIVNQINAATHYFDLSFVYGATVPDMDSVRQFEGGKLAVHVTSNNRSFPKLSDNPGKDCNYPYPNITCFHSGDLRVNQNTEVTCLQTVLLREHNRIAVELGKLNVHWNDEQLFQEARRILIAEFQHITYDEWLSTILGESYVEKNKLKALKSGFTTYNSKIDATTFNSFATGAYRIFHSQIQGTLKMYNQTKCPFKNSKIDEGRCPFSSINISDHMNRPGIVIQNNNYDAFLLGLTTDLSQTTDRYFTTQMTDLMFHGDAPFGEDLESFDIQRGRDHGLAAYNKYREVCNLKVAQNFDDLSNEMSEKHISLLKSVYENVNDIDLFVGMILETAMDGSTVGPTALCILVEEFVRKKFGDRFWYEVGNQKHSFTKDQLQEIRKVSLSRLICDNSDNITTIQPKSFRSSSVNGNSFVDCKSLPSVDLSKWKG